MAKPMKGVPTLKDRNAQEARGPYTKEELLAMLPKVGERRMEKMTASTSAMATKDIPRPCVVVEVNPEGLWYRVQFERTGVCQCYKVPELNWAGPRMEALYK